MWLEHKPTFRVVARFTADGSSTLSRYVAGGPLPGLAEAQAATFTLAQLRAVIADIARVASAAPLEAGIDVRENRINVYVTSIERFEAFVRRSGFRLPATAKVQLVESLSRPVANIYGGLPLDTPISTTGFSVYHNETGMRGVTTAGHAANTAQYAGSDLPFQREAVGGSHDEQWHSAPGFTVRNWINDGVDITTITSRTFLANQAVGTFVCKFGRTTASGCGNIAEKNYAGCVQPIASTYVRVTSSSGQDLAAGGDSGGPVFVSSSAYGMISCEGGTGSRDLIYVAVDYIESGLGVTILTSP